MYLILRTDFKLAILHRKTTPKLFRGDICSILYSDILLNSADKTPELLLYQLCGNHLKCTIRWRKTTFTVYLNRD